MKKGLVQPGMAVKVGKIGPVYQPGELTGRETSLNEGLAPIME